jgi:hypothetical protein
MSDASRWISVGELAEAFSPESNTPPPTGDLAGRTLKLHLEDGRVVACRFESDCRLFWEIITGEEKGRGAEETYRATKVREGIYFVDFVERLKRATAVSTVLDLAQGIATALVGKLPAQTEVKRPLAERVAEGKELTAVSATFYSAALDVPFAPETRRHAPTGELVGRRVEYTYSLTERYEHIYLNEDFYTWHCLLGSEKGLADTDRCHYYKLAESLYLFVWREKIVPTLGVVVVDMDQMTTAGKIFGYQGGDFGKLANFPVGAHARLLNITTRD